jgi:hypothetical protein
VNSVFLGVGVLFDHLLFFRLDVEEVLKKLVGEGGELGMAD